MRNRRASAAPLITAAIVVMALGASTGAQLTLGLMTGAASVSGNTLTTGTWATTATTWYLHNAPTPPVAGTFAQFGLGLDATAPVATTLFNYDMDCDGRVGRSIRRGAGAVSEAGPCLYATWRSPVLAAPRVLTGTATLRTWARKTSGGGTNPTLRAYLRVFDPGASTYVELGSASVTVTTGSAAAWASYALSWSLASVSVPAGRQIEVKIVATGSNRDPEIAYDTQTSPTSLQLP